MQKIKFLSKTKEGWEKDGQFDPPFIEVEVFEKEAMFDIGRRNEINELTSECIFISRDNAKKLSDWLIKTV